MFMPPCEFILNVLIYWYKSNEILLKWDMTRLWVCCSNITTFEPKKFSILIYINGGFVDNLKWKTQIHFSCCHNPYFVKSEKYN
jgi:hypothetical protein